MKLYYTTSSGVNERQPKPHISLGGFKSSSPVLNDNFNNLFSELSLYTISKNNEEYISLFLINELPTVCNNIQLWVELPETSYALFEIAGVIPAQNGDGDWFIERIETRTSKPFFAEFEQADEQNKYSLGELQPQQQIGIWIKRKLLIDKITDDSKNVYQPDPNNLKRFIPIKKETEDNIKLHLSWD